MSECVSVCVCVCVETSNPDDSYLKVGLLDSAKSKTKYRMHT